MISGLITFIACVTLIHVSTDMRHVFDQLGLHTSTQQTELISNRTRVKSDNVSGPIFVMDVRTTRRWAGVGIDAPMSVSHSTSVSQTFSEISTSLHNVGNSTVAWGDYNNDNILDVFVAGRSSAGALTAKIYQNDGNGVFTDIEATLPGIDSAASAWGDYNNDGYLDLLVTGCAYYTNENCSNRVTRIYRNDGPSGAPLKLGWRFTDSGVVLDNIYNGAVAWGDYDRDGKLDILLIGNTGSNRVAKIYRNEGPAVGLGWKFTETGINLTGVEAGSVAWGDFNNDGLLDILLTGWTGSVRVTKLYKNNGPSAGSGWTFVETSISLPGVSSGSAFWGDYNKDGKLDIVLTGFPIDGIFKAQVYRNEGPNAGGWRFTNINAGLTGVDFAQATWGDYDNDGQLDILLAGYDQIGNVITKVYRNNSGVFYDIGAVITGVYVGSAIWGDYDNDGRLDILVSGCTQWMCPAVATKLYHNSGGMVNTPPDEPTGLVSEIKGNTVTLSWQPTTDGESQSVGLTYNVRVGTTPSGTQVQAPMADTNTGHRRIVALGSSGHALTTTLRNIMPGVRYYWSVQAVDSSFTGSAFASERSFGTVVSPDQIRITGPANGTVNIPYRFVATIGPTNTTLPLTYTWQISGKSVVSTVSGITNAVNISWSTTGVHGITATVANEGGEVVDTSAIIVSGEPHYVYMPIVTIAAPHRLFLPYFVHRWPPVPYTPILNEISNPSGFGTYTVNWSTAQLADGYVLQEDDNSTFSSPDEVYRGAATSWVTPIPRQAGTYYYRVNAYNSWGSSEFSNANATTVFLPEAPVLSPINNSDQKNTYVLNWTPSMRATAYHVQEDSRADFSSPRAVYTGTSTTWTITDKTPGTYYYRVIAGGPTGTSEWSNTQSRTIYPFFVGLSLRWDGEGYIRIDEYYDVGTHVTRNCDAMTDADTIRCVNSQWYDPDPKGWGRENWNAYYSLSTGNWRANSVPSDPAWKWSEPYVLPYDWYLYNGQELAISGKIFLVSGPYEGITAFGKRVSYWRLVNRDRFLYVDSGSQWTQYVHPGDIVLHYDAGSTRLLLYRNTLRRYYYNGSLTSYTVQYIQQLTSANSFPGANVLNRVVADRDISSADFGNRNKTQDVDSTRILGQESGEGQDERRVYRGDQQRIDSHDEARDHMLE